jgi:hypothetical protein
MVGRKSMNNNSNVEIKYNSEEKGYFIKTLIFVPENALENEDKFLEAIERILLSMGSTVIIFAFKFKSIFGEDNNK